MMIGTRERDRRSRHTSTPEIRGSITSRRTSDGCRRVELVDRLLAVGGHLDAEALALQRDRECVAVRLLVVDHEDERGRFCHHDASESFLDDGSGTRNRNVEPSPSIDSTVTSPPCACATWRTIERPRPVPPVARLRARSTR